MHLTYFVFLLIFLNSINLSKCIASYSIDLSSEFLKVAVVKPGIPMEIALNSDSQRKTPAVVYIKNGERLFDNAALNMGIKFPKNMYHSLTKLLGKNLDESVVQQFLKDYPYYEMFMTKDGLLAFKHDEKSSFTVEELLGMLLQHAKDIADNFAEMKVKSGIIVVPPYFNQNQRNAVIRSAKIAGLEILQLINSNAAVALNYGVFRRKVFNSTAQYYMFYDVGSSATIATVVGYQVTKQKDGGMLVDTPQLTVYGLGYSEEIGTIRFALRLQQHLADAFNKMKKTSDVRKNPRAMAKLLKEASRVMKVLSANTETYAQVENVKDEIDLRVQITRTEFESMCNDLMNRFREPLVQALEAAQVPLPTIKEVILMGGGTRIPRVQEMLMKEADKKELGKSVNTDEAAALGAVYQAARVSPGFRVKQFNVKDSNLVPIWVEFMRFKPNKDDPKQALVGQHTSRLLFNVGNPFPQKKVLTFNKHTSDFEFNVTLGFENKPKELLFSVQLDNLTTTMDQMMKVSEQYKTEFKGVKAHFGLENSGIFSLGYVEALFEKTWASSQDNAEKSTFQKIGNTISNLFGGSESKDDEAESKKKEEEKSKTSSEDKKTQSETKNQENKDKSESDKIDKDTNKTSSDGDGNKTVTNSKSSNDSKPLVETLHENIKFTINWPQFAQVSEKVIEDSKQRLYDFQKADEDRKALEKAQNELEAYIFSVRSSLEDDTSAHYKSSSPTERETILTKARELADWYDENGGSPETTVDQYNKHKTDLTLLMNDIDLRVKEAKLRPPLISALSTALSTGDMFLENLVNLTSSAPDAKPTTTIITDTEFTTFKNMLRDTKEWFKKANESLAKSKSYENPPISAIEFETQVRGLEREIGYLFNKVNIWRRDAEAQAAARKEAEEAAAKNTTSPKSDTKTDNTSTKDDQTNSKQSETPKTTTTKDSKERDDL